jgi:DNA-binding MarR family transcriptional regulator
MHLSRQAVQRVVDRLSGEDLLVPEDNPDHRTSPLYRITDAGLRTLADLEGSVTDWHAAVAGRLTAAEIDTLTDLLAKVHRAAEDYRP